MKKWKNVTIPEFSELYMVSNEGDVYSVRSGKCLKPKKSKAGYYRVGLAKDGKVKSVSIHRLVALAFVDNPLNKPTVNHINEIKTDNRAENLEWATNKEQNIHGTRIERARKHTNYKARGIDYKQVAAKHDYNRPDMCGRKRTAVYKDGILLKIFESQKQASDFTGISQGKLSECINGKNKFCKGYEFRVCS